MIKTDTIIALATPPGIGAISVIRLSGIDSIIISNKLFKALNNLDLITQKTHSINLGYIMDCKTIIDKVLISVFKAPRSYTGENIVEISLTVQYNIDNARDFVLNIKDPETSLKQATDSALRHVVGSTGLDGVISTGREQVALGTAEKLQELLTNYGSGINVVKINIEEARPPTEVKAAYDDVIKAREDLERLVNEAQAYSNGVIPEARGEAQRLREEAEGYKSQVVSKSEGEAKRFTRLFSGSKWG